MDDTVIKEKAVEADIENAMTEKIKTVLLELGKGFSFVGSQYKISTPQNDYYIDMLFYHLELRIMEGAEELDIGYGPLMR